MPWLEKPEWCAWEAYAGAMTDENTPDTPIAPTETGTAPEQQPVETHAEVQALPETPPADVIPFPSDMPPVEQPHITGTIAIVLADDQILPDGQRFPVENEAERIEDPRFAQEAAHVEARNTVADPDAYARKIHTSRSERLRGE